MRALLSLVRKIPQHQISKKISKNNYLWIACLSDKPPHKQDSNLAGNIICKPKFKWLIKYYSLMGVFYISPNSEIKRGI